MTLAAVQASRARHQNTLETLHNGSITIGTATMDAAVTLGRIEQRMDTASGNWHRVQTLTASVRKTLLTTSPAKRTVLTYKGVSYQIDDTGGQDAQDIAWHIKASRKLPSPA